MRKIIATGRARQAMRSVAEGSENQAGGERRPRLACPPTMPARRQPLDPPKLVAESPCWRNAITKEAAYAFSSSLTISFSFSISLSSCLSSGSSRLRKHAMRKPMQ